MDVVDLVTFGVLTIFLLVVSALHLFPKSGTDQKRRLVSWEKFKDNVFGPFISLSDLVIVAVIFSLDWSFTVQFFAVLALMMVTDYIDES